MKPKLFIIGLWLAVELCACQPHSSDTVPSGCFRLVINDMVKDDNFRVASLKVSSARPGALSVDGNDAHAAGDLLLFDLDKLRSAKVIFIAGRILDSFKTNALIQVGVLVKTEGGDGRMLLRGSFQAGGSKSYSESADAKLDGFLSIMATNGIYPLGTPLKVGEINKKPVTLTITDQSIKL